MPEVATQLRPRRAREPFAVFEASYLRRLRPLLASRQFRAYEETVLACDGWVRQTTNHELAAGAGMHPETMRKSLRDLERIGLIRRTFVRGRTSPLGLQRIEIVRDFDAAIAKLQALREQQTARTDERRLEAVRLQDLKPDEPETQSRASRSHLIARSPSRSEPDLSSLPSPQPQAGGGAVDNGSEGAKERTACAPLVSGRAERETATDTSGPSVTAPTQYAAEGQAPSSREERGGDAVGATALLPRVDLSHEGGAVEGATLKDAVAVRAARRPERSRLGRSAVDVTAGWCARGQTAGHGPGGRARQPGLCRERGLGGLALIRSPFPVPR